MKKEIPYVPAGTEIHAPRRGTEGAAGWDVEAAAGAVLRPFESVRIASGIRAAIPEGCCLLLIPRSGLVFKTQLIMPNSLGVLDEDFRGDIGLTAMWVPDPLSVLELYEMFDIPPNGYSLHDGHERTHVRMRYRKDAVCEIKRGDRLAQALLISYHEQDWRKVDDLSSTARGHNGFGSTGHGTKHAGDKCGEEKPV